MFTFKRLLVHLSEAIAAPVIIKSGGLDERVKALRQIKQEINVLKDIELTSELAALEVLLKFAYETGKLEQLAEDSRQK